MFRGTTPTHEFILPFEAALLNEIRVTYKQNDAVVLEKTEADCTKDGSSVKVELTQEETLLFDSGFNVDIQLRVSTTDGKALASQIEKVRVCEVLNEEVLTV